MGEVAERVLDDCRKAVVRSELSIGKSPALVEYAKMCKEVLEMHDLFTGHYPDLLPYLHRALECYDGGDFDGAASQMATVLPIVRERLVSGVKGLTPDAGEGKR